MQFTKEELTEINHQSRIEIPVFIYMKEEQCIDWYNSIGIKLYKKRRKRIKDGLKGKFGASILLKLNKIIGNPAIGEEGFIKKARQKFGNKYNYSLIDYINTMRKVTIVCPVHGEFKMTPGNHLRNKTGCLYCKAHKIYKIYKSREKKITTEQFVKKVKQKFGDRYDYSLVNYVNSITKVILICPEHNKFEITPNLLLHSTYSGCKRCTYEQRRINRLKTKYGGKDSLRYYSYREKDKIVTLICSKHGKVSYTLTYLLCRKPTCPKCRKESKFIEKAKQKFGDRYDYSLVNYVNSITKVILICPEHGKFEKKPMLFLHYNKVGCIECGKKASIHSSPHKLTTDIFVKRSRQKFGDKYDYSLVNYVNYSTRVTLMCPEHGKFESIPNTHLSSKRVGGCKKCNEPIRRQKISKGRKRR